MKTTRSPRTPTIDLRIAGFQHEALFYKGDDRFDSAALSFLQTAIEAEEPTLVLIAGPKINRVRAALGDPGPSSGIYFGDMAEVGLNPTRLIGTWRRFVGDHAGDGRTVRGLAEPIWAGRRRAEVVEAQRHESLLDLAFAVSPRWQLLCLYDAAALDDATLAEARASHRFVTKDGRRRESDAYRDPAVVARPFDMPLPDPPATAHALSFGGSPLDFIRSFVAGHAARMGLDPARVTDLVVAVNEVASNTERHAGGAGTLRIWEDGDTIVCEVRDSGRIDQPLVGTLLPPVESIAGRGLWMVNQLCDLVELRTFPMVNVVRLHMRLRR